jgi:hypothetical protein
MTQPPAQPPAAPQAPQHQPPHNQPPPYPPPAQPMQQQPGYGPGYAPGHPAQPGYGYPPPPVRPPMPKVMVAIWTCAAIAVLGVVLGLSLKEDGNNAWHSVNLWGVLPILGAVLVAAPAFGGMLNLPPLRAGQLAVGGAAALVLYWVLFVLPSVGSNTSLLTTLGVAAGAIGAWLAPNRDEALPSFGNASGNPSGNSW